MPDPLAPEPDGLLPAAMRAIDTRGRQFVEDEHPFRNPFQRDRDRIIHASAFRRLEYKTQVFVNGEGDNYRTRLTHTLEVTQIARTIARELRLNEDLAEAVALSHDLGHTPFGHAGEDELNTLMKEHGGFDHNAQGLRVVDILEKRYAAFDGLNLTYEVREAFIRHGGHRVASGQKEFSLGESPLLEVAATLAADDIAYIAHDIDDGLFSGLVNSDALEKQDIWRMAVAVPGYPEWRDSLKRTEGVRRLINLLVTDLIRQSRENIQSNNLDKVEKVKKFPKKVIDFSEEVDKLARRLKEFLFINFYRHPNVMAVMKEARKKLSGVFQRYVNAPETMPADYKRIADREGIHRAAADYVAGMTDRFATEDYSRNFSERAKKK